MAFKASKSRAKREVLPVAEGRQLIPSASIREWYEKQLIECVSEMREDYRREISGAFDEQSVQRYYAGDSSPITAFTKRLASLKKKWLSKFATRAMEISSKLISKTDAHSTSTIKASLSTLGIKEPRTTYNENIDNTLKVSQEFNNTLISNIQAQYHERVFSAVMESLTSPEKGKQGQVGIISALNEIGIKSNKRARLIARDQTAKVYSALNTDRMRQNGVTHFKWVHSSAGKTPRHTHVEKDGMIFSLDDPRLWEGPAADQGPPGHAINCRCRAVPVLDVDEV